MDTEFRHIFHELYCLFRKPWTVAFALYFGCVIVIINGIGVLCAFKYSKDNLISDLSQNLSIYSIALFAPSIIALILQLCQDQIYHKVSFAIISIFLIVLEFYAIPNAYQGNLALAILCTIVAWIYWVIANRDNEYLSDESFDKLIKKGSNRHGKGWAKD